MKGSTVIDRSPLYDFMFFCSKTLRVFCGQCFSCSRVRAIIDAFKAIDRDGSVDLRCGQLAVAEQFLNTAQVGTVVEEVGRESVAQLVWTQLRVETRLGQIALERKLHGATVKLSPVRGNEQRLAVERAGVEISPQRSQGRIAERAEPFLPAQRVCRRCAAPQSGVARCSGRVAARAPACKDRP
jgi:hypothetical protein